MAMQTEEQLRSQILELVGRFAEISTAAKPFTPGVSVIPPSGKVIGGPELQALVDSSLDGWLTTGRFNEAFQKRLGQYLGAAHVLTTNSGSSSNLVAFSALTSPRWGEKQLKPGDEVITVAAGFPTTVNPIVQHGCVPVFVDVSIPTYNIDVSLIEQAITPKTKAIMIAHTLGNPFNLAEVTRIAQQHDLWLVEDCCDALGSTYDGKMVGSFGDIATLSFYPAHHITMGEGGAVFTNRERLRRIALSIRDWGRDCHCEPGVDNTCGNRFGFQLGDLPCGYDHKYTYSHIGYNLKITDMQAAVALAQMDRLESFVEARKKNFAFLKANLAALSDCLILPEATPNSDPSWFGFPLTLRDTTQNAREKLLVFLDKHRIGTRLLFAGNLTRQPYFKGVQYRAASALTNTDIIMDRTFWLGVYPGLDERHLSYVVEKLTEYFRGA